MLRIIFAAVIIFSSWCMQAQQLLLLDRFNGKKIINDSTVTVFSSDFELPELTQYYVLKNNTDRTLNLFLRKTVNILNDSTTDYFCFGAQCWPGYDSTDIPLTIAAGASDSTFASHVCHVRRFDRPPLVPGLSSITYTIYDRYAFPQPVEATVTVIYHLGGLGVEEEWNTAASVYPNPASERITIRASNTTPGHYTLHLFNHLGMPVLNKNIFLQDKSYSFTVSDLPCGLYFGRMLSEQGYHSSFRFEVMR